jgi:hypothetical protein
VSRTGQRRKRAGPSQERIDPDARTNTRIVAAVVAWTARSSVSRRETSVKALVRIL